VSKMKYDEDEAIVQNTVENNLWDQQNSESFFFNSSNLLMDVGLIGSHVDPSKGILKDLALSPSRKFYEDDY
jgi:hypothetical protein